MVLLVIVGWKTTSSGVKLACEFIQGVEIWNSWRATRCLEQLLATLSPLKNHCMMIFEKYVKQRTIITTTTTK